ncbi:MAG TPA: bifunctional methylenetetrahydrofolate dehydrogenase/methenyltetrahydrofolate cyclohydrolase FolD [Clostridiales bacterium]|nr:bifunctional methylenetetrahydrofolate dehydrogenase/methenyltetrahydrofolate cyclohydrolase FolD [Clostridiales bacterium]
MNIINGKEIAAELRMQLKEKVEKLKEKNIHIGLAVIIVGDNPASRIYVNNKKKACAEVGIESFEYALPAETTQEELINLIEKLNNDKKVNGILVQLPVPKHIDDKAVINAISVKKDVDGFSHNNMGKLATGDYGLLPCTPAGIIYMLKHEGIQIAGKHCVVIGRSNIVGKPVSLLMLDENATVTICHSKTPNLKYHTLQADIIISAVGHAKLVTADMVKKGAVIVDVGMNKDENGKLCGDVDFENVAPKCSYITPVPGGVGPMTIAMLLNNTVKTCEQEN